MSGIRIDKIKRSSSFSMSKDHVHDYYELYTILSGQCRFFVETNIFSVTAGSGVIIAPGTLHHTTAYSGASYERFIIYFHKEDIQPEVWRTATALMPDFFESRKITVPNFHHKELSELMQKIHIEAKSPGEASSLLLTCYTHEFLLLLLRYQDITTVQNEISDPTAAAISQAAEYISSHLMNNITLEDAANVANLSSTYFSKKFKELTGVGFKEYMNHQRIKQASTLLLQTNHSITEISEECGFHNSNYFGDLFKQMRGVSPSTYRKMKI